MLIVEDSAVLGTALSAAIGAEPDLEIVGLATTVADALVQLQARQPDVLRLMGQGLDPKSIASGCS